MNDKLVQRANETVEICRAGYYKLRDGRKVNIAKEIAAAIEGSYTWLKGEIKPRPGQFSTEIEVTGETTFEALARLTAEQNKRICCLNFASAKNPGGGFLRGTVAQEESLAYASGLYVCLEPQKGYYLRNRALDHELYLDEMIYSPNVPFIRDDFGLLLEAPVLASVITAPAPNLAALKKKRSPKISKVEEKLRFRARVILGLAWQEKQEVLVLGAWGCGVFGNDPELVAKIFAELLQGDFAGCFKKVVFAVFDKSTGQQCLNAFRQRFTRP